MRWSYDPTPDIIIMSATTTLETLTEQLPTLTLRPESEPAASGSAQPAEQQQPEYRYEHLLPVFVPATYPPLEPYEHVDPGHRALAHPHPRAFLDGADRVVELTPFLGTEVSGVSLAQLDADGRDQLALEVCARGCAYLIAALIDAAGRTPGPDGVPGPAGVHRPRPGLLQDVGPALRPVSLLATRVECRVAHIASVGCTSTQRRATPRTCPRSI
jgi:hypothetical protein